MFGNMTSGQWNELTFQTTEEVTLGDGLLAQIQNALPNTTTYAIGIIDNDYSDLNLLPNGTPTDFVYDGSTGYYHRVVSHRIDLSAQREMTATYLCAMPANTTICVFYI